MTMRSHRHQNSFDSITYCTWIHFIEMLLLLIKNCTLLEKIDKVKIKQKKKNEMK